MQKKCMTFSDCENSIRNSKERDVFARSTKEFNSLFRKPGSAYICGLVHNPSALTLTY